MNRLLTASIAAVAAFSAVVTVFFGFYGIRLVYFALTYDGPGSLGHVGMYIAAGLFPVIALVAGFISLKAWRVASRRLEDGGMSSR
jgi:uncharacterized membrane protein